MAYDLGRAKPLFDQDREQFRTFLTAQATGRDLAAAIIIKPDGSTVERADVTMDQKIVLPSRAAACRQINETDPQVALIPEGDHVAAVVKLHGYDDMYLYVARLLDPRVVQQLRATQESVGEYANLEARRLGIQIAFALMFTVIALIVLLVRGLDRTGFRQPAGGADPPPDRRRQRGLDRQSPHPGAGAPVGRRSRPDSAKPSTT